MHRKLQISFRADHEHPLGTRGVRGPIQFISVQSFCDASKLDNAPAGGAVPLPGGQIAHRGQSQPSGGRAAPNSRRTASEKAPQRRSHSCSEIFLLSCQEQHAAAAFSMRIRTNNPLISFRPACPACARTPHFSPLFSLHKLAQIQFLAAKSYRWRLAPLLRQYEATYLRIPIPGDRADSCRNRGARGQQSIPGEP